MMKKLLLILVMVLMVVLPAEATITVPFVFSPFTTIASSQVNSNFSTIASEALDKRGDTMTGTLNTQVVLPDITATRDIGSGSVLFRNGFFSGAVAVGSLASSGALSGTTLSLSGAISGATTGGFSGAVTAASLALSGAITGATTGAFASTISVGGTATMAGVTLTGLTPTGTVDVGASGTKFQDGFFSRDVYYGRNVRGPAEFNAGNSGASTTVDFAANGPIQMITRNAGCIFSLNNPPTAGFVSLKFVHDGTGTVYAVVFAQPIRFPGGVQPVFTNTANGVDLVTFYWDGVHFFGSAITNLQ